MIVHQCVSCTVNTALNAIEAVVQFVNVTTVTSEDKARNVFDQFVQCSVQTDSELTPEDVQYVGVLTRVQLAVQPPSINNVLVFDAILASDVLSVSKLTVEPDVRAASVDPLPVDRSF